MSPTEQARGTAQGTKLHRWQNGEKTLGETRLSRGGSSPPARRISSLFQLQQSQSVSGPLVPGVFPRWMSRWRGPHWRSVSGAHLCVLDSADGQGCRGCLQVLIQNLVKSKWWLADDWLPLRSSERLSSSLLRCSVISDRLRVGSRAQFSAEFWAHRRTQRDAWTPNLPLLALVPTNTHKIPVLESMLEKTVGYVLSEIIWKRNQICIIILDTLSLKVTASNLLSAVGVLNVNPKKWKKESLLLTELLCSFKIINPHSRAVMILDSSYHGYCGHKDSRYRYTAICLAILGGGGGGGVVYQSNHFLLCLLSFSFSPNRLKDTDKRWARYSGFLCFFGAPMKYCHVQLYEEYILKITLYHKMSFVYINVLTNNTLHNLFIFVNVNKVQSCIVHVSSQRINDYKHNLWFE